jgi:hypothetical protein
MIDAHTESERLENMVDGAVRINLFDDRPLGLNALFRFQLGSNVFDGNFPWIYLVSSFPCKNDVVGLMVLVPVMCRIRVRSRSLEARGGRVRQHAGETDTGWIEAAEGTREARTQNVRDSFPEILWTVRMPLCVSP